MSVHHVCAVPAGARKGIGTGVKVVKLPCGSWGLNIALNRGIASPVPFMCFLDDSHADCEMESQSSCELLALASLELRPQACILGLPNVRRP